MAEIRLEWKDPVLLSVAIHLSPLIVGFVVFYLAALQRTDVVDFEVIDVPVQASRPIRLTAPPQPKAKPAEIKKRAVHGVSRKAITSEEGIEAKAGNTITKAQDDLKLREDDEDALPIPTEEYLVSNMPVLQSEFRIPYPPEARKKGVEGPVVMDLLIDSSGQVRKVDLVSGPEESLNQAALQALPQFKFRPAEIEGRAVAVRIRYVYRFVLEK